MDVTEYETRADAVTNLLAMASGVEAWEITTAAQSSTEDVLELCAEIRRLQAGIQAVRDEAGKIHTKWAEAKKDPSLAWYEDDPALDRLSERDDVQDDIIAALNTALIYKTENPDGA